MNLRRLIQFRLSSVLWLMLVIAAGLGGYRAGLDEKQARHEAGTMYNRAYRVQDLVLGPGMTKPDFDSLIEQLVLLSPQKWQVTGGAGCVTGYDEACIIVVHQDEATHRQIERKLAAMRHHIRWHWIDRSNYVGRAFAYLQNDEPK